MESSSSSGSNCNSNLVVFLFQLGGGGSLDRTSDDSPESLPVDMDNVSAAQVPFPHDFQCLSCADRQTQNVHVKHVPPLVTAALWNRQLELSTTFSFQLIWVMYFIGYTQSSKPCRWRKYGPPKRSYLKAETRTSLPRCSREHQLLPVSSSLPQRRKECHLP